MSTPAVPPGPNDPFGPVPLQQPSWGQYGAPAPSGSSGDVDPGTYGAAPGRLGGRPRTVTAAAWITIAMSVLTALGNLVALLALPRLMDYVRDHPDDVDLSAAQLDDLDAAQGVLAGTAVVFILAAVVACVLAVLVLRRRGWARIALVVLAALCVLVGIVGFLTALIGGLWVLAAGAVIVLLFTGGANAWFARRADDHWSGPAQGPAPRYPPYGPA